MDEKSHESLFVKNMGHVTLRGLTIQESAALYVTARKKSLGNQKAMKWLLLIGTLHIGIYNPQMTTVSVEEFVKRNPKDAAKLATRIIELTHD